MGKVLAKKKLYDEAIKQLIEAQLLNPKISSSVCIDVANCFKLKGDNQSALNYYDKLLLASPELFRRTRCEEN